VFDIEESKVGERPATRYSLDMASVGDGQVLPETRQIMESFFGPGGKFRIWFVTVDDQTVLVANATSEQVTAALQTLARTKPVDWNKPELAAANKLLPEKMDWRFFFSPRGYSEWKRRENDAMMNGVPVIGAKPAKDFSASPPLALAGKLSDNELEVNAAIAADTIKSASEYFKK
jgi:hypothetical protein